MFVFDVALFILTYHNEYNMEKDHRNNEALLR